MISEFYSHYLLIRKPSWQLSNTTKCKGQEASGARALPPSGHQKAGLRLTDQRDPLSPPPSLGGDVSTEFPEAVREAWRSPRQLALAWLGEHPFSFAARQLSRPTTPTLETLSVLLALSPLPDPQFFTERATQAAMQGPFWELFVP